MELKKVEEQDFFTEIINMLKEARKSLQNTIDITMVITNYKIGERIVKEELNDKARAEYGKELIRNLSDVLTKEFGRGYSVSSLYQIKQFYLFYREKYNIGDEDDIFQMASGKFKLGWSTYLFLMRIENDDERKFYEIETLNSNWTLPELKRQYDTGLYLRLSLSRDKDEIKKLSQEGQIIKNPKDLILDPYVLEFLGLPEFSNYSETELETHIINKLEHFLLELGKGFLFQGRQVRFTFGEQHFFVDLVFYNRLLKCFVLIDLKIGDIKHQDLGQMSMYVNYYDREVKTEDENKTIGIVLCRNKNDAIVKMTLPEDNTQIFASKYLTVLPTKEELEKLLKEE